MVSPRAFLFAMPTFIAILGAYTVAKRCGWSAGHQQYDEVVHSELTFAPSTVQDERIKLIVERQGIARKLLGGEITVLEAANSFYLICQSNEASIENLRLAWPGRTDWERAVRQTVAYARSLSYREPNRYSKEIAGIEAEAENLIRPEMPLD